MLSLLKMREKDLNAYKTWLICEDYSVDLIIIYILLKINRSNQIFQDFAFPYCRYYYKFIKKKKLSTCN